MHPILVLFIQNTMICLSLFLMAVAAIAYWGRGAPFRAVQAIAQLGQRASLSRLALLLMFVLPFCLSPQRPVWLQCLSFGAFLVAATPSLTCWIAGDSQKAGKPPAHADNA